MKSVVCEGDAQLIGMRGKRKHICDITATINYIIKLNNNNSEEEEISVKIIITDITADRDYEFEIVYPKITPIFTNLHKTELINQIKTVKNRLTESIGEFLTVFVQK